MTPEAKMRQLALRANIHQLIDYVGVNPSLFNALINTYLEGPHRVTQRSASALTQIASKNPSLLKSHFNQLIDALNDQNATAAIKRNTIRMFQFVRIPVNRHGQIIDICFRYLQDKKETIAVKVFAMSVIELLTYKQPELRRELKLIVEDELVYAGPAFRSRGFKVLKKLT
jgi:hypothetical protein